MMRVVHAIYDDVANPWVGGGGATRVRELYRRLADRVEATIITGRYPGARDETIDHVRYVRLGAARPYAWSRLSFAAAANVFLRRAAYDAAVLDFSSYSPIWVPRRHAGITVHHITGAAAVERFGRVGGAFVQRLERTMLNRAQRFSATSSAMANALASLGEVDLVQAGVDDSLFDVERKEQSYLLCFGRLDVEHKGLDVLLAAFAAVAPKHPRLELRLAGRGREHARVAEMARALGLGQRVVVEGPVSALQRNQLFSGALAVIVPSRFEGFGIAAAEAMAAGAPCIVTDLPALREVVGDAGIFVPSADTAALARALDVIASDTALRADLSQRARALADRFRWSAVADAHYLFLQKVAA